MKKTLFYLVCFLSVQFLSAQVVQKNTFQIDGGMLIAQNIVSIKSYHLGFSYERALNDHFSLFGGVGMTHGSGRSFGFSKDAAKWGIKANGFKYESASVPYPIDPSQYVLKTASFGEAKVFYANVDAGLAVNVFTKNKHQLKGKIGASLAYTEESGIADAAQSITDVFYNGEPIRFVIPYYLSYYVLGANMSFSYRYAIRPDLFVGLTPTVNAYATGNFYYGVLLSGGFRF